MGLFDSNEGAIAGLVFTGQQLSNKTCSLSLGSDIVHVGPVVGSSCTVRARTISAPCW